MSARLSHSDLAPAQFRDMAAGQADCLVLTFLDPGPSRASLLHIRRIKRAIPSVRVGVVIWQMPKGLEGETDLTRRILPVAPEKLAEAEEIGADFVVTDLDGAFRGAFSAEPPRKLKLPDRRRSRSGLRPADREEA